MRSPVDKRYAKAIVDLGVEKGNLATLQAQLRELADAYEGSSELRAIMLNPSVRLEERRSIVRSIAQRSGWDPMVRNFTLLLLDNDRFAHITGIADTVDQMVDRRLGNVRAKVTTAWPIKDSQLAVLQGALARLTGKNVLLESDVDDALLGGVVTRVGSTVYDGSVRTQLQSIREAILEEV